MEHVLFFNLELSGLAHAGELLYQNSDSYSTELFKEATRHGTKKALGVEAI